MPASGTIEGDDILELAIVLNSVAETITAVQVYLEIDPKLEIVGGLEGIAINKTWDLVGRSRIDGNRIEFAVASTIGGCSGPMCEVARFSLRGISEGTAAVVFVKNQTIALTAGNEKMLTRWSNATYTVLTLGSNTAAQNWHLYN